jgi:hypothetical protein
MPPPAKENARQSPWSGGRIVGDCRLWEPGSAKIITQFGNRSPWG